jgi:hypothetical protein
VSAPRRVVWSVHADTRGNGTLRERDGAAIRLRRQEFYKRSGRLIGDEERVFTMGEVLDALWPDAD